MSATYTVVAPPDAALTPPPGVIPDFQDPYSLRPYWIVTAALGLLATGSFLGLRLYTKIAVVKKLRWEDYTCLMGFICFAVWIAFNFLAINAKAGAHQWNLTNAQMATQFKNYNYSDIFYSPAVGFTKVSILLLVMRIFCPQKRDPFYWVLQSLNIMNSIFYSIFIFIPIFLCNPREKIWFPKSNGKCLDIYGLYIASAAFNIASDLAMYFVPLWKVWHLQMSKGRKLGISAIFATGSLAILSSIFRLVFAILFLYTQDYSAVKVRAISFTLAELAFGLICSCLFVLPRLYRHLASTASVPYRSEEYELRKKYRGLGSATQQMRAKLGGGSSGSGSGSGHSMGTTQRGWEGGLPWGAARVNGNATAAAWGNHHGDARAYGEDPRANPAHNGGDRVKREQEGRNDWENDVEAPVPPPKPLRFESGGL